MKLEELSIMGMMLLLFGITWIAYAASLPIPVYTTCTTGPINVPTPLCGSPSPQAQMFYALGALALIISVLPLYLRVRQGLETTTPTSEHEGRIFRDVTPPNFLKKCGKCGTELPLAAEKCYSCGARV